MDKKKVRVTNMTRGSIGVKVAALNFSREWMAQGSYFDIEEDVLEELMYDPGFKYMIDQGMLYIEDMSVKQELGIEPSDAEEPVNVIVLTDKDRRRYMVNLSQEEFEEKVSKLTLEQVRLLADYAIDNRLADYDKAKVLQKICQKDVIQAIKLNDQAKEE